MKDRDDNTEKRQKRTGRQKEREKDKVTIYLYQH